MQGGKGAGGENRNKDIKPIYIDSANQTQTIKNRIRDRKRNMALIDRSTKMEKNHDQKEGNKSNEEPKILHEMRGKGAFMC